MRRASFDSVITGADGPTLHELALTAELPAAGRQIIDLHLPVGVLPVLVRRGDDSFCRRARPR